MLAVYAWGSILTDDYVLGKSDIDTIAIVEDSFPLEKEVPLFMEIREKYPELGEFYIRFIYLSELNGGPARAPLATVIYPPLHLLEMPQWHFVAGKQFVSSDFSVKTPSITEAIQTHLQKLRNDGWDAYDTIPNEYPAQMWFLKTLMRLVDVVQRERDDNKQLFSYHNLTAQTEKSGTQLEKDVIATMLTCRDSKWDPQVFATHKQTFLDFIAFVKETHTSESKK
ncbi:MAG: hypothetical protein WC045_01725 [Patescibacteria group bacterium]